MVGDLALLQQRIHRHHDGAESQSSEVDCREVGDVGQLHCDPVADVDSPRAKQAGGPRGRLVEQLIIEDEVVELDRGVVRMLSGRGGQLVSKVGHEVVPATSDDTCISANSRFSTFPVGLRGSSSKKTTSRGTL